MFEGAASNLGRTTDVTMLLVTGVVTALLLLITSLLVYFSIRYRRSRNPESSYIEGSRPLEWGWTVGGIAIVLLLFYWGLGGYRERKEPPLVALEVRVWAQAWTWSFEYPEGKTGGELVLPLGKPVRFVLNSRDFIHSFFMPAMRVKEDVVPGMEKVIWFIPERVGEYDVFCTEYCGTGHSMMRAKVKVVSAEEFTRLAEAPIAAAGVEAAEAPPGPPPGAELLKARGCTVCHSLDGKVIVGPSFKGLYGKKETVVTAGKKREVLVDEAYIRRSMLEPQEDLVEGFPPVMPAQKGLLSEEEIKAIIEFMKTVQ